MTSSDEIAELALIPMTPGDEIAGMALTPMTPGNPSCSIARLPVRILHPHLLFGINTALFTGRLLLALCHGEIMHRPPLRFP